MQKKKSRLRALMPPPRIVGRTDWWKCRQHNTIWFLTNGVPLMGRQFKCWGGRGGWFWKTIRASAYQKKKTVCSTSALKKNKTNKTKDSCTVVRKKKHVIRKLFNHSDSFTKSQRTATILSLLPVKLWIWWCCRILLQVTNESQSTYQEISVVFG